MREKTPSLMGDPGQSVESDTPGAAVRQRRRVVRRWPGPRGVPASLASGPSASAGEAAQLPLTVQALAGDALPWRGPSRASFRSIIQAIVRVSADDPDKRRRGQILAFLSTALFLIGAGFLASDTMGWLGGSAGHAAFNVATDAAFCGLMGALWMLNRRGHVTLAAVFHLSAASAGLVFFFYYTPPVRMEVVFVEPVVVAAFVLEPWAAFIWAGVSSASFVALNTVNHGEQGLNLQVAGGLLGMAIIACLVASCLEWTVAELQSTAADLEKDIVARRKAEREREQVRAALSSSEERNRTLFETSTEGIFLFDYDLVITDCNARFAAQAQCSKEGLVGLDHQNSAADWLLGSALREALAGRVGHYKGPWRATRESAELWVSFTASPQRGADGEVCGGIGVLSDLTGHKQAEELVERLAYFDGATGLPNRTLFGDRLRQALASAERGEQRLVVGVLDIDRFKNVIDTLGNTAGDDLLAGAAKRIGSLLRESDSLARSATDEFLLLLPQVASMRDAIAAGERILDSLRQPWEVGGSTFYITASIGFAVYPMDGAEGPALLENAHAAMRRAKKKGGNTQQFFDRALGEVAAERLLRESELHAALEQRQFVVHYQPEIDALDGTILGVEALVRWQHPVMGLLPPSEFIAMAEETGLIVELGEQVLRTACAQAAEWQGLSRSPLRVAVNLSARQLQEPNLPEVVARTLAETGLAPQLLDVEITETSTIGDAEGTTRVLQQLREMGVAVSLDDFGTGYSSLSHLPQLPITRLKIDRSFVSGLPHDASSAAVVCAVIDLASALGLDVTAEGVETQEQLEFLRDRHCHEVQGFLFSPPLAAEECRQFLLRGAGASMRTRRVGSGRSAEQPSAVDH